MVCPETGRSGRYWKSWTSTCKIMSIMFVKSKEEANHIANLEEAFNNFCHHRMKLNPSKCMFGVSEIFFWFHGHPVRNRSESWKNPDDNRYETFDFQGGLVANRPGGNPQSFSLARLSAVNHSWRYYAKCMALPGRRSVERPSKKFLASPPNYSGLKLVRSSSYTSSPWRWSIRCLSVFIKTARISRSITLAR